jgi:hypothetical protein
VVYPRLKITLGREVGQGNHCESVLLGEFMVLSRKERRCGPWEIKDLRRRERKNRKCCVRCPDCRGGGFCGNWL